MSNEHRRILKYVSGLCFGLISSSLVGRILLKPLIQSIPMHDENLRLALGLLVFIIGLWIPFYLAVYFWRRLLVSMGLMTKEEARAHPFCVGVQSKRTGGT
jgi:cytochrome c biogenesis protein CcdA